MLTQNVKTDLNPNISRRRGTPFSSLHANKWGIVELTSRGLRNKTIAKELSLSPGTVKNFGAEIIKSVGAHNMPNVIFKACSWGLFAAPLQPYYIGLTLGPAMLDELALAADGYQVTEASALRGVAYTTSKNTRERLRFNLGAETLAHAVRIGFEAGFIQPTPAVFSGQATPFVTIPFADLFQGTKPAN